MPKRRDYWFGRIESVEKSDGIPYPGKSCFWIFPYEKGGVQLYFHRPRGYRKPDGEKDTLLTYNKKQ